MNDTKGLLQRARSEFPPPEGVMESLRRRRDRKRRNQRIAAGVVGIAVFVAAVWIVTSGLSLDRSEKSVAPAGEVTGPAETGPAKTAPPTVLASAAPDVVKPGTCSDDARSPLELTDIGDRIRVRFEVHLSPVGHSWHIRLRHANGMGLPHPDPWPAPYFEGTRVASDSGDLVVQGLVWDRAFFDSFKAKAWDTQTGQTCRTITYIMGE